MAWGCGANCAKIILIVINIIFLLTGFALLGVGIYLFADPSILKLVNFIVEDTSDLFRAAAIFLIALGVFVLIVSILGFVGACIEHPTVLGVYITLLAIVFAGEVACGIVAIVYKDEIRKNVDRSLEDSLGELTNWLTPQYYVNTTENKCAATSDGALWDYLQVKFNCCGVHNDPSSGYDHLSMVGQFCPSLNLTRRPVTCCVQIINDLDASDLGTEDQLELKRHFDCSQYKRNGCSDAVVEWIEWYAPVIIGMGIGVGMFELLVIIFALCLCQNVTYNYKEV